MTSTGIYAKLTEPYIGIQTFGSSSNPGHMGLAAAVECCPCDCVDHFDDFLRADTTDVGAVYYEHTGDWGIEDFACVEKYADTVGTANAVLMCKIPITSGIDNGHHVSVSFVDAQVDDEYYIYVACDDWDDPASGLKVTFKKINASEWTVTIPGGGAEGTVTITPSPSGFTGGGVRGVVCADHLTGMVMAHMGLTTDVAWADDVDPGTGLYCGFGHNNTGHQNVFDDFGFSEMRTASIVCSDCWCWCLLRPTKRHLVATITGASGRAACLNGVEWEMDWNWNVSLSRWEGTAEYPKSGYDYQEVDFWLYCDGDGDDDESHPGKNFTLYWAAGASCCNVNTGGCAAGHIPIAASSTCDPFSLTFGPFYLSYSDLTCYACLDPSASDPGDGTGSGYYYIVITEAS